MGDQARATNRTWSVAPEVLETRRDAIAVLEAVAHRYVQPETYLPVC